MVVDSESSHEVILPAIGSTCATNSSAAQRPALLSGGALRRPLQQAGSPPSGRDFVVPRDLYCLGCPEARSLSGATGLAFRTGEATPALSSARRLEYNGPMSDKERLHALVDELPEPEVHTALRFVEYLRHEASDPVARALQEAPIDDEPVTAEDLAALEDAERDWQEGRTVSHDEARVQLLREP